MKIRFLALAALATLGVACSTSGAHSGQMKAASMQSDQQQGSTDSTVSGTPTVKGSTPGDDRTTASPSTGTPENAQQSQDNNNNGSGASGSASGSSGMSGSGQGSGDTSGTTGQSPSMGSSGSAETSGSTGTPSQPGTGDQTQGGMANQGSGMHGEMSGSQGGASASAGTHGGHIIAGRVMNVSSDSITIMSRGRQQQLKISDQTQVTVDGQQASATDLKPGEFARAAWSSDENGNKTATTIEARKKAKAKSSKSGKAGSSGASGAGGGTSGTTGQ